MVNQTISERDYAILYFDVRRTYMLKVEAGNRFHTHKGYLILVEVIGMEVGATIQSSLGIAFTLFKPSTVFYLQGRVTKLHTPGAFADFMNAPGPAWCFLRDDELRAALRHLDRGASLMPGAGKKTILFNRRD